jgi:hypothetical protein
MSSFTKTLIVDADGGGDYKTIRQAAKYFIDNQIGGVIYVESGEYVIDGTHNDQDPNVPDKRTVLIPNNTTLIGRGNAIVKVTAADQSAFRNEPDDTGTNNHITLIGFKIIVACGTEEEYPYTPIPYASHLIDFRNVSNCTIEKITIDTPDNLNPGGVELDWYAILIYSNGKDCVNNIIRQCHIEKFGNTIINTPPAEPTYNWGSGIGLSRNINLPDYNCKNNIIKNNYVAYCHPCLYCFFAEQNIIRGNIFKKGIGEDARTSPSIYGCNINIVQCKNMVIIGNQVNETDPNTGGHGLYPSGCTSCVIMGNIFNKNRDAGIKIRFAGSEENPVVDAYHTIMGNVCNENGADGHGIHLQGYAQWNSIIGNSCCKNVNDGIRVQAQDDPAATNNIVAGNVCVLNEVAPISIEDPSNIAADNKTD